MGCLGWATWAIHSISTQDKPGLIQTYHSKRVAKGQTKLKWFFQANVSSKKRTNEFWRKLKIPKKYFEINWLLRAYCPNIYTVPVLLKILCKNPGEPIDACSHPFCINLPCFESHISGIFIILFVKWQHGKYYMNNM